MPPPKPTRSTPKASASPEVVHPMFLLKGIGLTILAALICGYLSLCLLFYQGQWQLILHPIPTAQPLANLAGIPVTPIKFDAAESGIPRLTGALLPAAPDSRYAPYTVLYLRGGDSSLVQSASDAATLAALHALGLNLFAFDYRGYGASDPTRPNNVRMAEDAGNALRFLTESRALPEGRILLYGTGVGASLAATLAADHPRIPILILDTPGPTPLSVALADPRTHSLPVRFLFHETFTLTALAVLTTPKLLISNPGQPTSETFQTAANPKMTLSLSTDDDSAFKSSLSRFLDMYLRVKE